MRIYKVHAMLAGVCPCVKEVELLSGLYAFFESSSNCVKEEFPFSWCRGKDRSQTSREVCLCALLLGLINGS